PSVRSLSPSPMRCLQFLRLFLLHHLHRRSPFFCFFFTVTAPTQIYTLSLHDALPISGAPASTHNPPPPWRGVDAAGAVDAQSARDRKSTRLNSSHVAISYAVFCLKKKKIFTAKVQAMDGENRL